MFISDDNVLYRKNKEQHQFVSTHALKEAVYRELHINMAYLSADTTLQFIRETFYSVKMEEEVRHFINQQCPCVRLKKPHIQDNAPPLPITSSSTLKIVGSDSLHPKKSSVGFECILLITDHFTRYTQAYPTRNKTAKTAATHLYNNFLLRFIIPSQLLHNQGWEFEKALFKYFANLLDIQKSDVTNVEKPFREIQNIMERPCQ